MINYDDDDDDNDNDNNDRIIIHCGSRKYLSPPMEGHWKFQGGGGS